MDDDTRDSLGTYLHWAEGFSPESVERSIKDLTTLRRGQLYASDELVRPTPAGLTESHFRRLRASRDDLDFREWNGDAGFSGLHRRPDPPGVRSESQLRRQRRRDELEEGF